MLEKKPVSLCAVLACLLCWMTASACANVLIEDSVSARQEAARLIEELKQILNEQSSFVDDEPEAPLQPIDEWFEEPPVESVPSPKYDPLKDPRTRQDIARILSQRASAHYDDRPLHQVLEDTQLRYYLPYERDDRFDERLLQDNVSIMAEDLPLAQILDVILGQLGFVYDVQEGFIEVKSIRQINPDEGWKRYFLQKSARIYQFLLEETESDARDELLFKGAEAFFFLGKTDKAYEYLMEFKEGPYLNSSYAPRVYLKLGQVLYQRHEFKEAQQALYFLLDNFVKSPYALPASMLIAKCYVALGEYNLAEQLYENLMAAHGHDPGVFIDIRRLEMEMFLHQQRYDKVITVATEMIKRYPYNDIRSDFDYGAGMAYLGLGDSDLGIGSLRGFLILNPNDPKTAQAAKAIAKELEAQGRLFLAIRSYEVAIKKYFRRSEDIVDAYIDMARLYAKMNLYHEARAMIDALMTRMPNDYPLYKADAAYWKAITVYMSDDDDDTEVLREFLSNYETHKNVVDIQYTLVRSLLKQRKWEEAWQWVEKMLKHQDLPMSYFYTIHHHAALLSHKRGDLEKALTYYRVIMKRYHERRALEALVLEEQAAMDAAASQAEPETSGETNNVPAATAAEPPPTSSPEDRWMEKAMIQYADILFELKRYQDSQDAYQKVIETLPKSESVPWALYQTGRCAQQMGQYNDAMDIYESVKTRYPEAIWSDYARNTIHEIQWLESNQQLWDRLRTR